MDLNPILSPALEIQPDASVHLPDLGAVSGLVFTSANGVRAYAARSDQRALTAWCVGPATATAALEAGFEDVRQSAGNSINLANLIITQAAPSDLPLLHIANKAAKGRLKQALEKAGFQILFAPIYRAVPAQSLSWSAKDILQSEAAACLLIHSEKGAEAFLKLSQGHSLAHLTAVCVSEQAASPLRQIELKTIHIAAEPNEDMLMAELENAAATLSA